MDRVVHAWPFGCAAWECNAIRTESNLPHVQQVKGGVSKKVMFQVPKEDNENKVKGGRSRLGITKPLKANLDRAFIIPFFPFSQGGRDPTVSTVLPSAHSLVASDP
jgi:hypothetical protein